MGLRGYDPLAVISVVIISLGVISQAYLEGIGHRVHDAKVLDPVCWGEVIIATLVRSLELCHHSVLQCRVSQVGQIGAASRHWHWMHEPWHMC